MFVPVKTKDGQVLMPMHPARARKLVKRGKPHLISTMVSIVFDLTNSLQHRRLNKLL